MGECNCSNIAIMQLFHELKQQFPALPDHVVSQCIAQNSHDREICARSLRATQNSRPSPGAFPPPAPSTSVNGNNPPPPPPHQLSFQQRCMMNQVTRGDNTSHPRPHRPASLDIGVARHCPGRVSTTSTATSVSAPLSAPPTCPTRGFFEDLAAPTANGSTGFELNVNVACSPAGTHDFRTVPSSSSGCKRSDLVVEPRPHYAEQPQLAIGKNAGQVDHTRSYTSVSLTLRPPSSEPQPPIDIRSQGSSLTYSTSSLDPRGFQSRLQISIGPGNVGSVAAARIRPPLAPARPNSLVPPVLNNQQQRPPGLPAGPSSLLLNSHIQSKPTTMSAPTTPSVPTTLPVVPTNSLPTTPSMANKGLPNSQPTSLEQQEQEQVQVQDQQNIVDQVKSPLNQVAEHQRRLVAEQLVRRDRLAKELRAEKGRLEAMKKELQSLAKPFDSSVPPQELKRKLRSEIYQLQVECDRLAEEVDQWSDPRVPLGETNEEFYQGIYTGQPYVPVGSFNAQQRPPPLPNEPPAWQPLNRNDSDRDDRDGPSWVCRMCTFDNHPLMNKCEQCDMPKLLGHSGGTGETQDIHIRVTHHHNFSPRRTVRSWVV